MNNSCGLQASISEKRDSFQSIARFVLHLAFLLLLALSVAQGGQQENSKGSESEIGIQRTSNVGATATVQNQDATEGAKKAGAVEASSNVKPATADEQVHRVQRIVKEGVTVEFAVDPVASGREKSVDLMEGEDAVVQFKIIDSTGTPMRGLRPAVWMDLRRGDKITEAKECRDKIQAFLQTSLSSRPAIDLNTYYILALNQEPNISVIDPLLGYGSSKLLTLVLLKSPGEDWVLSSDRKRLFVTMPLANQVAVIDTNNWKVIANIDAGSKPSRIAFQPDEKYLWVTNDLADSSESGVTVIDSAELKLVSRIKTGTGHHQITFTSDDRYGFVTNQQEGTVSIINVQKLVKIKDIKLGHLPKALAYSPLSKAIYVIDETEGTIAVVDSQQHQILTRLKAQPGLSAIRFTADGRWGFVANGKENVVHIFDSSTNRILQTIGVGKGPDQISFTKTFAYIRSIGSAQVSMIQLTDLGKAGAASVLEFPGGQIPPESSPNRSVADAIVPAPEGGSVLVANPADKFIYYYSEGMAAPMGSFKNYGREPRAVIVVDRSLRETTPGIYSTSVKLTASGDYDVAFLLDSPRIVHCFNAPVMSNPALKKKGEVALQIESLIKERRIRARETVRLQFKLTDRKTNQPKVGLKDVGVLTFLSPGIWQKRQWANPVGEGIYEITFVPPEPGVYFIFFECPSLLVRYNQLPHLILQATDESPAEKDSKKGEEIQ